MNWMECLSNCTYQPSQYVLECLSTSLTKEVLETIAFATTGWKAASCLCYYYQRGGGAGAIQRHHCLKLLLSFGGLWP